MNIINNFDEENIPKKSYNPGDIVTGTVAKIEPEGAWIDIGEARLLYLPISELSLNKVDRVEEVLELNQMRDFLIDFCRHNDYYSVVISLRLLEEKIAIERIQQIQAENATIYAKVSRFKKTNTQLSGLFNIEGLSGFVQNLNVGILHGNKKEELMEKTLSLKIDEIYRWNCDYSYHITLHQILEDNQVLKKGDLVTGKVFKIRPYGAFVDIGQCLALLRITEISSSPFQKIEEIFQENDEIKAVVIYIDIIQGRITISTKVLEPAAGDMLKNPQLVYAQAEEMAEKYRQQLTDINPHQ